jgi:hypothetical protein
MTKKTLLCQAVALAVASAGAGTASAEWDYSGYLKNETAVFASGGETIGARTSRRDTGKGHNGGDVMKSEITARAFINGDVGEESSVHAELQLSADPLAVSSNGNYWQEPKDGTQQEFLRELYFDTRIGDTDFRIGKQQVVWGTADGIKLLDIINPTDYREFAQNTMEDSRIPVWMVNADMPVGDTGSLQFIVSLPEENKIPGLRDGGDRGHPFIMKGVDTITGPVNGFMNIAPAMGQVSRFFQGAAGGGQNLFNNYQGATVQEFVDNATDVADFTGQCAGNIASANCLYDLANDTGFGNAPANTVRKGGNQDVTALIDADDSSNTRLNWDTDNPNTVFEYMRDATFATFYSFTNMTTEYRRDYPEEWESANLGFRFKDTTDGGTNWSVNYLYAYDPNPYIELSWEDQNGNKLETGYVTGNTVGVNGAPTGATPTTVFLATSAANAAAGTPIDVATTTANLVFTEKLNRIHNLGASFDTTIETGGAPIVLRGEFLYQKDVMQPVVDMAKLRLGDLVGALKNEKHDFFKYVIGADFSIGTNLLFSTQFIQFINLDYVDVTSSVGHVTDKRYTADPAVMHLSNGFKKAQEYKEFVSLFFSKPFGEAQRGRWNNITIVEDEGGYWNRFDMEYSFSDELVGTAEWNQYWGDSDSQFGQMKESSSIQMGVKYIF